MVFNHLLGELLYLLRLGFLFGELCDFDLVPASPMHQSGDFLVGVSSQTLLARLLPLSKLASLTDTLSLLIELICLAGLARLSRLIELVLTRLGLALLAAAILARLILTCLGLLILLPSILPKTHAANTKHHHESDNHFTHRNTPEK